MNNLTEAKIRNLKPKEKRYKVADGNGLYLEVRPNGGKSWLVRISGEDGSRSWKSIGSYPTFDIQVARQKAIDVKRYGAGLITEDPISVDSPKVIVTFRRAAEEYAPEFEAGCSSSRSVVNIYCFLEKYIYPAIGDLDISSISTKMMYETMTRMRSLGITHTVTRSLQLCSRIFRYAILKEYCTFDPCYALRGQFRCPPVRHRPALTEPSQIGELMRAIDTISRPYLRMTLKFVAYTFCRSAEVRGAQWTEMDLDRRVWLIPAERMKKRREHAVPLTDQLMEILEEIRPFSGHKQYIFQSLFKGDADLPIGESTLIGGLRSLGYTSEQMTVHGFRSIASTLLNEKGYNFDWIEMQLAHAPRDAVRAAYNRAKYWDDRVKMCQWYADYLDELRDRKIV